LSARKPGAWQWHSTKSRTVYCRNPSGRVFAVAFTLAALFFSAVLGRFCKHWLPLAIWMVVIFSASTSLGSPRYTSRFIRPFLLWLDPHMSARTIEQVHHAIRKSAHFCEYAMLGLLAWQVLHGDPAFSTVGAGRQYWLALLFCALYASSDEFHQKFVPSRQPAVLDVLLDTCGAGFGLFVTWCIRRLRKARDT
jgi:VanZ family protein